MRILMITSELAPLAKVGGLADMAAGLGGYLVERGHEVMAVMPDYGGRELRGARLAIADTRLECSVHSVRVGALPVWRVSCPEYFGDHAVYHGDERDAPRFLLLSLAALAHARRERFRADVVHAHDWHASASLLLDEHLPLPGSPPSLLTIHNIGYQGTFAADCLRDTPFAPLAPLLQTEEGGALNFLRAGVLAADALSTVSPTHAAEILTPQYGMGLETLLLQRRDRLHGILNGADYKLWAPQHDKHLVAPFSAQDLSGKRLNRSAAAEAVGLDLPDDMPLVCVVGRLMGQKGIDLLIEALPALLESESFALAVLGDGEEHYVRALSELAAAWPHRIALRRGHHEQLAHRLMAGSDMLLMPSRYEPCGLTQLYAMRYGTIPVVRATGGLVDTVRHFDPATGDGSGVVFLHDDIGGVSWGLRQALQWFAQPQLWRRLMHNAMAQDFSWTQQGARYETLYRRLCAAPLENSAGELGLDRRSGA